MKQCSASANFDQLFKQISAKEICDKYNAFSLFGKDFYLVTAGKENHYNSMTGSGGGLVQSSTWCLFQSNRYTLELIQKEQTYNLVFFPDEYKKQFVGYEDYCKKVKYRIIPFIFYKKLKEQKHILVSYFS